MINNDAKQFREREIRYEAFSSLFDFYDSETQMSYYFTQFEINNIKYHRILQQLKY